MLSEDEKEEISASVDEHMSTCADTVEEFVTEMLAATNGRKPITVALVCQFDNGTHTSLVAGHLNRVTMLGILEDLKLEIFHTCKKVELNQTINDAIEKITLAGAPLGGNAKLN